MIRVHKEHNKLHKIQQLFTYIVHSNLYYNVVSCSFLTIQVFN